MRGIMTMAGLWLAALAGPAPLQGQGDEQRRVLAGNSIFCRWETAPYGSKSLDVSNWFQLMDGALVLDYTLQSTDYRPEQVAGPRRFRLRAAELSRSHPRNNVPGAPPENFRYRLTFLTHIDTRLGRLSLRFLWNGNLVHTASPRVRVDLSGNVHGDEVKVDLSSSLPLALLGHARGPLEVQLLSAGLPEPVFTLTYQLDGFEYTDWHRDAVRHPDLNAAGVRPGGLLPRRCTGMGSRPAPAKFREGRSGQP